MSSNRLKAFTVLAFLLGVAALLVVLLPRTGSNIPSETPSIPAEPASQPGRDGVAKPGVLVQKSEPARSPRANSATATRNGTALRTRPRTFTGNEAPIRESANESLALQGAPTVRTYRPSSDVVAPIDGDAIATGRVSLASAPVPILGMIPQPSTAMGVPTGVPAPEGVVAKPSLSSSEPAAPAVPAEPAFCPLGTVEKSAKAKAGGKERFCSRPDKGGILFREGPYLAFHANGKKRAEGVYVAGRMGGTWTEYYDTGRLAGQGEYAGGKRSGNWVFYWESGRGKSSEGLFRGGVKNGRWIFYDDRARKESEGTLTTVDNVERKTGRWTYWHSNGTRRAEGVYRDGRREGKWTEWNVKGQVASVDVYRDGEKE